MICAKLSLHLSAVRDCSRPCVPFRILFGVNAPSLKYTKAEVRSAKTRRIGLSLLLLLLVAAGVSTTGAQGSGSAGAGASSGAGQGAAPAIAPSSAGSTGLPAAQGAQGTGSQGRFGSSAAGRATAPGNRGGQDTANPDQGSSQAQGNANPPAPLTQFQRLVASSTGGVLPIFGASLFSGVPSTFAPVTDVPVGANYPIGPGDELNLQISGQVNQQYDLTVDRTGNIDIPELGTVHVTGIPFSQLNSYLHTQLSRIYRNFALNTNLGSLRTIQVFVVGEAVRPGSYTVSSLSTLLNAVFTSGGPLPDGSLRDIQVKRDGRTLVHFDLYDLLLRGDKTDDVRLLSGDVIFIPFVGAQVAVAGSVDSPAIYELKTADSKGADSKGATSIDDVLKLAGGETAVANGGTLRLERVYEHSMRSVEDINPATQGMQSLQNGDILSVSSIIERFRNAVTLRGNVATPGRYVWHPGMRLSDLIPDKASLVTRNYWTRQNQQGQLLQDYAPGTNASAAGQGALQARSTTQSDTSTSRSNGGTQAGGNALGAALSANSTNFSAQTDVILSAPDIDWSYAVIERLDAGDLKTSLIPFNLGKLVLDGDALQNLELEPNDIVTIFSTADIRVPSTQQTRYVRLEGEFIAPGVYSVLPGETLRGLLRRAGGFTPDAYLFASEFTRESTRRVETQRLQEYADQLDAQVSQVTADNTARATSASDQAASTVSETAARAAVARLRTVTPSGRIVLDLQPNSIGVDTLPNLALEDGDRFVVPRVPSEVTVQGQVYNANAFVYTPRQHMLEYLRRAGGPDRQADRKREFILRADGSVISEQYADVRRASVFPGDTLVVPPIIDRRATFQRILDLASIATSFGLSAATLYLIARD